MGSKLQKAFPSSSQRKIHDMKIQLNGMESPACEYGCGLIAVTQLKTGRWCCGEGSDDCPEVRRMIKETMKKVGNTDRWKKMSSERAKIEWEKKRYSKKSIGDSVFWSYREHDKFSSIDYMYTSQCEHGCGNLANFQLNNGRWCCKETAKLCDAVVKHRTIGNIGRKHSEEMINKYRITRKKNGIYPKHSEATKQKLREIRTGEKNPFFGKKHKKETFEKIRMTRIERGLIIPDDQLEGYKKYNTIVRRLTRTSIRENFTSTDLLKRGKCNEEGAIHVDHKYSIYQGFLDDIPPERMAHYKNLELIPAIDNSRKRMECSITKEELYMITDEDFIKND